MRFYDKGDKYIRISKAHKGYIAALAVNTEGTLLASCSNKVNKNHPFLINAYREQ